ncbi:MAG: penicillin-binding transpeptidase domain-containing protein [Roseburia sp.]|nr:penicillin-binding transpeptidase domain-containing protein [Roseburia sp.]
MSEEKKVLSETTLDKDSDKKAPGKKRPMGSLRPMGSWREIRLTTAFFLAVFAGLIVYLCHFVATSEQEMLNNSYNSRQEILLSRNYRGSIFSGDGQVLAQTVLEEGQEERRVYPYANLFSHVVGYSTQGKMGVESLANYYLINTSIPLSAKVANDVAGVKNPGDNVYTTLNVRLQEEADRQLGMYRGAVMVTEVKTGRVLAMVSNPDFNPNEISDIWQELIEDSTNSVLVNRATQGLYPPGSTFKILTALEYIRENPDSYDKYSYQCNGAYRLGNDKISCYHGANHGVVSLERSFAKSCNSSFANIGMSLNRTAFANTLGELLFGKELPFALNYSKSAVHIPAEGEETAEMMQTSIGQGRTQMTPLHLNMITCAIANGGELMTPYLVDSVKSATGTVVKSFRPVSGGRLMSETEAAVLREFMTAVVEEGTATKLSGLSYTAAGKTGSAEYNDIKGDSHAWFTGFAPAENPEVCITIILEGAGSGGDYAVPLAKRILDAYFEEK